MDEQLIEAVSNKDLEKAKFCLSNGANPNAEEQSLGSVLALAVYATDQDMIDLLLSYGADPNKENLWGETPLMLAAEVEAPKEAFRRLLSMGANPAAKDKDGNSVINHAETYGHKWIAALLQKAIEESQNQRPLSKEIIARLKEKDERLSSEDARNAAEQLASELLHPDLLRSKSKRREN